MIVLWGCSHPFPCEAARFSRALRADAHDNAKLLEMQPLRKPAVRGPVKSGSFPARRNPPEPLSTKESIPSECTAELSVTPETRNLVKAISPFPVGGAQTAFLDPSVPPSLFGGCTLNFRRVNLTALHPGDTLHEHRYGAALGAVHGSDWVQRR
jgi:hypothetical protein